MLFLWLARSLSLEDYATFGLLYALQTGLMTLAIAGIMEAVVGLLKEHRLPEQREKLFSAANTAFALMLLPAILFALFVFLTFGEPLGSLSDALVYVLIVGSLGAYSSLQAQIVRLEEKHIASLWFNFIAPLSGLIGGFFSFFIERTVPSFFLGSAVGTLVSLLGFWINRIGFYGVANRISETRLIFIGVVPFIGIGFLGWLSGYGNNFLIKIFFESADVAKFTFAFMLSSIMQLVATAMNQVWSPRFYKIVHELSFEQVEKRNRQFFRLQAVVMGLVGAFVIALFPSTISMLGGNLIAYKSLSLELLLLFSAYILLSPWWHCQNYYLAHGKGSRLLKIVLITSAMGITVSLILMWIVGPIGIYLGFLAQMLFRSLGVLVAAKNYWPVKISWGGIGAGVLITFLGFLVSTN